MYKPRDFTKHSTVDSGMPLMDTNSLPEVVPQGPNVPPTLPAIDSRPVRRKDLTAVLSGNTHTPSATSRPKDIAARKLADPSTKEDGGDHMPLGSRVTRAAVPVKESGYDMNESQGEGRVTSSNRKTNDANARDCKYDQSFGAEELLARNAFIGLMRVSRSGPLIFRGFSRPVRLCSTLRQDRAPCLHPGWQQAEDKHTTE